MDQVRGIEKDIEVFLVFYGPEDAVINKSFKITRRLNNSLKGNLIIDSGNASVPSHILVEAINQVNENRD